MFTVSLSRAPPSYFSIDIATERGVDIEDPTARQESAPFAATLPFQMEMRLTVPLQVPIGGLRAELEALCGYLNCGLDLEPS